MLCWSHSKTIIAAIMVSLLGCVSHPAADEKTKSLMENWSPETLYSPNIDGLRAKSQIFKDSKTVYESISKARSELKNFYCNKGQQIRNYAVNLKLILPRTPEGISTEEANEIIQQYKAWSIERIADIVTEVPPPEKASSAGSVQASLLSDVDLVRAVSREKSRCCSSPQYFYSSPKAPLYVHMTGLRPDFPYGYSSEHGLFEKAGIKYASSPAKVFAGGGSRSPEGSLTFLDKKPMKVAGFSEESSRNTDYVLSMSERGTEAYNVFRVSHPISLEPYVMISGFTFLIPKEVQEKLQWGQAAENLNTDQETQVFYSVKSNGEFSTEQALRDRASIWKKYFQSFMKIEEAPAQDRQMIQYRITLDLAPFCRYSRSIDDLQTR